MRSLPLIGRSSGPMLVLGLLSAAAVAGPRAGPPRWLGPCGADTASSELLCGELDVPEDPARPAGRQIALHVVVVPAIQHAPGMPPLFVLDGGPGIAATNAAGFFLGPGAGFRQGRDVVLVDQRGTGKSHPLRCPALERRSPIEEMYSVADVAACRAELERTADLTKFSTAIAAADLDHVRAAFGTETVDIWAISYGTRLAQVYLKLFPDRTRSAVLVGLVPLDYRTPLFHAVNAQRTLDLLFFQCQRDESCSTSYPRLREEWRDLLARLSGGPIAVDDPARGCTEIHRGPFAEALRSLLGTTAGQRRVPRIIHAAAAGDFQPFLAVLPEDGSALAEGLYLTIACSEGSSRIHPQDVDRLTRGTFLGAYRVEQELAACGTWPTYPVAPELFTPPRTDVPLLILSGEMDHVAAPDWAHAFCATLPNCHLVSIPELGHGPFDLDAWTHGECFDELAMRFYASPSPPGSACVKQMVPPQFE